MNTQPELPEQPQSAQAAPDEIAPEADPGQPLVYRIRLKGHLGQQWTEWFEGAVITLHDNGDTTLTCSVADQAALHGLLKRVRDLGMPLLAINRVSGQAAGAPASLQPIEKEKDERQ
ncbi:MAG: hypothetical protein RMN52_06385 [Anaerolineae bacterium]|nr:hypothetical protein [Candidatus Roseilinea sp.]MDW8449613.1 hypothetical protein [Anaerolineae bacterium]